MNMNIYEGEGNYSFEQSQYNCVDLYEIDDELEGWIRTFPGCCGYAIWEDLPYDETEIKRTTVFLNDVLTHNEEDDGGFGSVICTVVATEQVANLEKYGWKLINEHINPLSRNRIYTLILQR